MSNQFETYKDFERMFEHVKDAEPDFLKLAMPKRWAAPGNYPNFGKFFVPSAYQNAWLTTLGAMDNQTVTSGYSVFAKLVPYQVPVYYVAESLCEALSMTAPAEGMMLSDVKFPMPALVFMIPTAFSHKFFGRQVNYIAAATFRAGEELPSPGTILAGKMQSVGVAGEQMILYYEAVEPDTGLISNYNSNTPTNRLVSDVYHDDIRYNGELVSDEQTFDPKADGEFSNRVFSFVIKLLSVMAVRPTYTETGECLRAAKMKHGRERDALWAPNYVGRAYKTQRADKGAGAGGTHASPRLHWRRGHMRKQLYGEKRALSKIIWLEPCLVGASEEETDAGQVLPSQAKAAK